MIRTKTHVLHLGDCATVLRRMPRDYFHSCVTDPPYGLSKEPDMREVLRHWRDDHLYVHGSSGFMGKSWDSFVPGPHVWREVYRVLKPGAYCLAFAGTRTYDLMALSLRFAGFEVVDGIDCSDGKHFPAWSFGSGFPKSQDLGKAVDACLGAERKVVGVKPGHEGFVDRKTSGHSDWKGSALSGFDRPWMHDKEKAAQYHLKTAPGTNEAALWEGWGSALKPAWEPVVVAVKPPRSDRDAAPSRRHFYCGKTTQSERHQGTVNNSHPTVKPVALMRYLARLVTPENGRCLDPFMGSGTTGVACLMEDLRFLGVEREPTYYDIALNRLAHAASAPKKLGDLCSR